MRRVEIHRHRSASPWTYAALDLRQRELADELRRDPGCPGTLLLSEVAPVITTGLRTPGSDLLVDRRTLARQGVEVLPVDRGGLATYHGPGQWVLFVLDHLARLTGDPRGVRAAMDGLLGIARDVGQAHGVVAEIRAGAEAGVWTSRGKFAAVGVRVSGGVLLHGLSINGYRTPQSFVGLRPCGLEPRLDFLLRTAEEPPFLALGNSIVEAARRPFPALSPDFPSPRRESSAMLRA